MRAEAVEQIDELPGNDAAARRTALFDLWKKCQSHVQRDVEQTPAVANAAVVEDETDGD